MSKSFEEEYQNDTLKNRENFIFSKESSETEKAIDEAEKKINKSVKIFANNLDAISPGLTKKLLNIFGTLKNNPTFKGLSESDLRLHSIELLYDQHIGIPYNLETILTEMLRLLTQYKSLKNRKRQMDTLWELLNEYVAMTSSNSNENKNRSFGIIPPTSGGRGR